MEVAEARGARGGDPRFSSPLRSEAAKGVATLHSGCSRLPILPPSRRSRDRSSLTFPATGPGMGGGDAEIVRFAEMKPIPPFISVNSAGVPRPQGPMRPAQRRSPKFWRIRPGRRRHRIVVRRSFFGHPIFTCPSRDRHGLAREFTNLSQLRPLPSP
jgi:hypothetical protein